jgi:DNA repair exonuclease SbcCD ATPase subunit
MPKKPIDYSKCCIYKIEHIENENLLYVGHTTCFNKRKGLHKTSSQNALRKSYNIKLYQMIRNNGGFEMFKMIEIEKYSCNDKREAERRENEIMKELKTTMNTMKSFLTDEDKKEYKKEGKQNNKEKVKEQDYRYYKNNKEKFKEYYENNKEIIKEREKEYREDNKDKLQNKHKKYYQDNKEKVKCLCGCEVNKHNSKRHQNSKKTYRFNESS